LDVFSKTASGVRATYLQAGSPVVENIEESNWGTWRHSIGKYLQGKKLRSNLGQMLGIDWSG